jgi:hypothetical protein
MRQSYTSLAIYVERRNTMENTQLINEMIDVLESSGEITMSDGLKEIFIQSVDDKEGYSYVSSTNKEFKGSKEAIEWAIYKMNGSARVDDWQ